MAFLCDEFLKDTDSIARRPDDSFPASWMKNITVHFNYISLISLFRTPRA
jgi:hypothetical protein